MRFKLFKIAVGMIIIVSCSEKSTREYIKEMVLEENYDGKVIQKFVNKSNHATPTIVLDNDEHIEVVGNIYDLIEVNDSIVKYSGNTKTYIYCKDAKIEVDNKDYYKW
jgi:hypothetical protein